MKKLLLLLGVVLLLPAAAAAKPLKVFILAGQSNMQGHVNVSTFDYMATDPNTAPILKEMREKDGKPRACRKVRISSIGCAGDDTTEQIGQLTTGYGAARSCIGPEFTFGIYLEKMLGEPILIIKTSWGGKDLHTDFRPPSAGPFVWSDFELNQRTKRGDDVEKLKAAKNKATGAYYRLMISHVRKVLADIQRVVPEYDPGQGYEVAGFVWFQGFNDLVSTWTYENHNKPGGYDMYGTLLADFIRDVRKDLGAPKMPFVIGVMGINGTKPPKHELYFRQAQAAPAARPEFRGNVLAVETARFWDSDLSEARERVQALWPKADKALAEAVKKHPNQITDGEAWKNKFIADNLPPEIGTRMSGVSNYGFHYLGAAKIIAPIGKEFGEAVVSLNGTEKKPAGARADPIKAELAGYLNVPHEKVDAGYNAGFSMYVAAWPLLKNYPGSDFQSGLFGTWMFPQFNGPAPKQHYSDIEGGLGWWRDTRFATETPKFIMGGVALEFSEWANGPGAGQGRDWRRPAGKYAIAQLSPWVLWPPDGLNLKQGTRGELLGYGYLPLPLTDPKKKTAGKDVPTGNHCWTLFLNTGNFKGPVTFFLPYFWSKSSVEKPDCAGLFLDTLPSEPNRPISVETQHIPAYLAKDSEGNTYVRIAPTQFPSKQDGDAPLVHRVTAYSKASLWDDTRKWFDGGEPVSGTIDPRTAAVHTFKGGGGSNWEIWPPDGGGVKKVALPWSDLVKATAIDDITFAYKWSSQVRKGEGVVTLPEYYRLSKDAKNKEHWVVVRPADVPTITGLAGLEFPRRRGTDRSPYVTPGEADSCWKKPGPKAGPFEAKLGDESVITYSWYRFADQPALLNADLTDDERESLQRRVEKLHRHWTKDRDYLPPPTVGTLADLDPALIVTPPAGLEVGHVPIVTRQAASD